MHCEAGTSSQHASLRLALPVSFFEVNAPSFFSRLKTPAPPSQHGLYTQHPRSGARSLTIGGFFRCINAAQVDVDAARSSSILPGKSIQVFFAQERIEVEAQVGDAKKAPGNSIVGVIDKSKCRQRERSS